MFYLKWYEVCVATCEEAIDAVSNMFLELGSNGTVIENPNEVFDCGFYDYIDDSLINKTSEDVIVKGYFNIVNVSSLNSIKASVYSKLNDMKKFLDIGKGNVSIVEIDDVDFANSWKEYYKPFHISSNIVIKPSWENYMQKDNEIVIELDPGMAFGTGTHETTKMCALFLEKYLKENDFVIDIGCGSGILSIIAIKLGARSIKALDIDKSALKVAQENCEINSVADSIEFLNCELKDKHFEKSNIIVANIIADVIIGIADILSDYLLPDGLFIASGVIKDRKNDVIEKYASLGYVVIDALEIGEWVAIAFLQNSCF